MSSLPDMSLTMTCLCFMAVPMCFLYEIGILMAGLLLKDKIAQRAKEEAEREAGA